VSGGFSPGDKKSLEFSEALHHLSFVILSDARRSEAPERKSKDLCTLPFQRRHQGILTVPSMIELICPAPMLHTLHKSYRITAAYPYYLSS
jgi:hypothetical protein